MQESNVFLLHGENTFASIEKLNAWQLGFKKKYGEEGTIENYEAKDINLKNLFNDIRSLPFLCEKKMFIIKNAFQAKLDLSEEIQKIPDFTILIFHEDKNADKRSKFYKALNKYANVTEFEQFDKLQSINWLQKFAEKQNIKISRTSLDFLVEHGGTNMWKLKNEIQKLSLLNPNQEISKEDIQKNTKESLQTSIFGFLDNLSQKNIKSTILSFQKLLNSDEEINMIFHMIVRQIRLLIQIKELTNEKFGEKQIISKLKLHPFVVKKTISQSKYFNLKDLIKIFQNLLKIEIQLKTGQIKISTREHSQLGLAIEKLLIEICSTSS